MAMKIGIFHPKVNIPLIDEVMEHVISGFVKYEQQHEVIVYRKNTYQKCDVAIRWGMHSTRYPHTTLYRETIDKNHKGPIGVIELGWLGDRTQWFQFGFNGISGTARYFNSDGLENPKRYNELYRIPLQTHSFNKEQHVLLIGQVPWDTSVQHIDYVGWLRRTAQDLLALDIPVVFRPHPKHPGVIKEEMLVPGLLWSHSKTLEEDLADARCAVGYNSNALLDALIHGVPAIACHRGSMVYPITHHDVTMAKNPLIATQDVIEKQIIRITNCQWSVQDFAKNIPWQLAKEGLRTAYHLL